MWVLPFGLLMTWGVDLHNLCYICFYYLNLKPTAEIKANGMSLSIKQCVDLTWIILSTFVSERVDGNASPTPFDRPPYEGCETDQDCDANGGEECQVISPVFPSERRCECAEGLVRDLDTHRCTTPLGILSTGFQMITAAFVHIYMIIDR